MGKSSCDCGVSTVVLHGDDTDFGVQRSVGIPDPQGVGKFEWQARCEQNLAIGAKLDDCAFAGCVAGSGGAGQLNRNADRSCLREKSGELADGAFAGGSRAPCGLMGHRKNLKSWINTVQVLGLPVSMTDDARTASAESSARL